MGLDVSAIKLTEFINNSKYFGGFEMKGSYNIAPEDFIVAFSKFCQSGENHLDEHAIINYAIDDSKFCDWQRMPDDKTIVEYENLLCSDFWEITNELREFLKKRIKDTIDFYEMIKSYEYARAQANIYIADRNIRKAIFERDGKVCKFCSSTQNLTLDHIVSIKNNGENTLENLQVLCKSCNSKKGDK